MNGRIEDNHLSGVYCVFNNINKMSYIGSAKNIYKRILGHKHNLIYQRIGYANANMLVDWNKYGKENFDYKVLEYVENKPDILIKREGFWIDKFLFENKNSLYNIMHFSNGKMIVADETRAILSKNQIERYKSQDERDKVSIFSINMWKNKDIKNTIIKKNTEYTKIIKFDKTSNEIIEIYSSFNDVLIKNPKYKWNHLYNVATGRKKGHAYGYNWKAFKTEDIV
jgi:group I intron endonuclease